MKINYTDQTKIQPHFKSNIIIVNKNTFDNLLELTKGKAFEVGRVHHKDFLIKEAAVAKPLPFTLIAYNCIVGTIINKETKLANMFHLSPYHKTMANIQNVASLIYQHAKKLKGQSDANLEGLILAGRGSGEACQEDRELMKTIMGAFSRISTDMGMDYSAITGRKYVKYGLSVMTDAQRGVNYVYPFEEGLFGNPSNKKITDFYEKVSISPNDTLVENHILF